MEKIYEFIKKCGTYYLATADGAQRKGRRNAPQQHGTAGPLAKQRGQMERGGADAEGNQRLVQIQHIRHL